MIRGLSALGLLAAAAAPIQPARAEFFTVDRMRAMCRGEAADAPQFRTDAGNRLLAQVSRERCRMYLLGIAESQLQRLGADSRALCLPAEASEAEVADALADALARRPVEAGGTVDEAVQDALRARYGCL